MTDRPDPITLDRARLIELLEGHELRLDIIDLVLGLEIESPIVSAIDDLSESITAATEAIAERRADRAAQSAHASEFYSRRFAEGFLEAPEVAALERASLGLASTRELLGEVRARAELNYSEPLRSEAMAAIGRIVDGLPLEALDYRTVD